MKNKLRFNGLSPTLFCFVGLLGSLHLGPQHVQAQGPPDIVWKAADAGNAVACLSDGLTLASNDRPTVKFWRIADGGFLRALYSLA